MKVLIVEDDPDTVEMVSVCLRLRWPQAEVIGAGTGREGLELIEADVPDLIILDIGLPDIDGREILRRLREFSDVPILMLTAYDRDFDIARSLEEGADDYMTKPFSPLELQARVRALTRRAQDRTSHITLPLTTGELLMDFAAAEVHKSGDRIRLTLTELKMLELLARNSQRVVTYESLASRVLGVDQPGLAETRLVRVHVQHLRSKLGDLASSPQFIANVRGVGYKFLLPVTTVVAAQTKAGSPSPGER